MVETFPLMAKDEGLRRLEMQWNGASNICRELDNKDLTFAADELGCNVHEQRTAKMG